MKIVQLQTMVHHEISRNLEEAQIGLEAVSGEKPDLVCLGEMFNCPYEAKKFRVYAQPENGYVWQVCSSLAKKYGVYLSAGSIPERGGNGDIYNTAYVFDPNGKQIAKHRKMHLFDVQIAEGQNFRESDTLTVGNHTTVFETRLCKIGLCVCYDMRFPELSRMMVDQGAQIILVPGSFNTTTGPAHWELLFRSRAVDNQVFTVGTSTALDLSSTYHSWGHSIVVSPWGTVLNQMDEKPGYQITEIDLEEVNKVRQELPLLKHRRLDIY